MSRSDCPSCRPDPTGYQVGSYSAGADLTSRLGDRGDRGQFNLTHDVTMQIKMKKKQKRKRVEKNKAVK